MVTDTTRDLLARLTDLLRREHGALADFLLALAEFDKRRGWRELGYAGLFPFLHRELRLSKAAAYFRKTAAELVQRFPEVVEPLRDGRLCLTSVVELSKVLTKENLGTVLPRFFHCSKQEAKAVSAELAPEEAPAGRTVLTVVRRSVRTERSDREAAAESKGESTTTPETSSQTVRPGEPLCLEGAASAPPSGGLRRDEAVPLTADLRRLHVTVSKRFLDKLDAARSALSHTIPCATTEQILEAALDLVAAGSAAPRTRSSSITRARCARAGAPPSTARDFCAGPTTTRPRGGRTVTGGWTGSRGEAPGRRAEVPAAHVLGTAAR